MSVAIRLLIFGARLNIFFVNKGNILVLTKWSYNPPKEVEYGPRMIRIFWAPIFWCPFLDPHLTAYHSNIGVHILPMSECGTSALEELPERWPIHLDTALYDPKHYLWSTVLETILEVPYVRVSSVNKWANFEARPNFVRLRDRYPSNKRELYFHTTG